MANQNILLKSNRYVGKYVAIKSFSDKTVVGTGKSPKTAIEKAVKKRGSKSYCILCSPKRYATYILNMPKENILY